MILGTKKCRIYAACGVSQTPNAIYYSEEKSFIKVIAFEEENTVNIEFQSRGEISQDNINSIFDKFSRLDKARQSTTGGAGLGLAIAKDIVELHGGEIFAESGNHTTSIIIKLPKKEE